MPYGCSQANFVPIIFSQVKSHPTSGSADCGPASVAMSLYIASCAAFDIGVKDNFGHVGNKDLRIELIETIRNKGGMPNVGSTSLAQNRKAFNAFGTEFAAIGKTAPSAVTYLGQDFDTVFLPAIQAGKHALVFLDYTAIDNYNNHAISGLHDYGGIHAVVITNYHLIGGVGHVTMVDPLADGRYSSQSGTNVVQGPVSCPVATLKTAMGQYAGTNKASYNLYSNVAAAQIPGDPEPPVTYSGEFLASAVVYVAANPNPPSLVSPNPVDPCLGDIS